MSRVVWPATVLLAVQLLVASAASATYYSLVSCNFEYVPEIRANKYIGVYKSQHGNLWTGMFDSYCPPSLNK